MADSVISSFFSFIKSRRNEQQYNNEVKMAQHRSYNNKLGLPEEVWLYILSFLDPSTTCWVSVSGHAKITNNKEFIKKLWSPMVSAWFGNLGDGIHKGDENDPRVSVLQVVPDEIRYWYATRTRVGQMAEIVTSAVTGGTAAPGELRTITKAEIQLVEGLNTV